MRSYLAHTEHQLRLLSRNRLALAFTYLFPLFFFIMFALLSGGATRPGAMLQTVSFVLTLGVIGSGLFGAGLTMIQEREENILRRFKVTPAGALPMLLAVLTSGLVAYLPLLVVILALSKGWLHVPLPPRLIDVLIFSAFGLLAFRAIGLLMSSVANTSQEGQGLVQLIYMPMLMLCGGMIPLEALPSWLQKVTAFVPSFYLFSGCSPCCKTDRASGTTRASPSRCC